jgi:hypothetical protein
MRLDGELIALAVGPGLDTGTTSDAVNPAPLVEDAGGHAKASQAWSGFASIIAGIPSTILNDREHFVHVNTSCSTS